MVAFNNAQAAQRAAEGAWVKPYIGNSYWVSQVHLLIVCDDKNWRQNCRKRWGHFSVEGVYDAQPLSASLQVTFDGDTSGYTILGRANMTANFLNQQPPDAGIYPSFLDRLPKKVADQRRKAGGVVLNMSEAEVLNSAWGAPKDKAVTIKPGYEKDVWYYPHDDALYFENGTLVKIAR